MEIGNNDSLSVRQVIRILLACSIVGMEITVFLALQNHFLRYQVKNQERFTQELRVRSDYDEVSNLKNRNSYARLAQQIEKQNTPVSVLICDIDGLKIMNDTLGHMVGDTIIWKAAEVLRETSPINAEIFRMGGDEFLVLIQEVLSEGELTNLHNSIKDHIERNNCQYPNLPLSMSIGFASSSCELTKLWEVVRQADHNMYKEKRSSQGAVYKNIREAIVE